ncbi:aspartyl/asparaginyl beta-hydroxylase domain-containing protein [Aestuariispira ectoiniformans]|uniref:aspartyl/asparaginyl beta-hydroxylase domain-containing protein n=1 Tax=Aestuariispira ectoiniformans TaxID=2775080 RepID=UPI00223B6C19|nr:aspartyl/asparaginyl beta-hydroxylase domain-containing protein [Aestuariispira ectoiniformans]
MNRSFRRLLRRTLAIAFFALLVYFAPYFLLFYAICGALDVMRHRRIDMPLLKRYFFGNGGLTWLLSPFNLLIDLLSKRNHYVYRLTDLPEDYQAEITDAIDRFKDNKDYLIETMNGRLADNRRGMLFLRWYDRKMDQSILEFDRDYKYIKTIAVSVFNKRQNTKLHFGPLRLTLRVLYNLTPVHDDNVFIEVGGQKHFWHDDPLFIFDDTLLHRSLNDSDNIRYCLFMDIVRPSAFPGLLTFLLKALNMLLQKIKGIFYKNWSVIR